MNHAKGEERPRLVELSEVPEFWADGVAKVEKLCSGARRLYLYRVRRPLDGEGPIEHEIVATVLTSASSAMAALRESGADGLLSLMN